MVTSGASGANKNTVLSIKTVPDIGVGGGATTNDITYEKYVDVANAIVTYLEQHPDTPFNYTTINGLTVEQFKNKVFTDLKHHEHINKDLLDTITVSFVSKYDSKQNAIGYTPLDSSKKGAADGYVPLDTTTKVDKRYFPDGYNPTRPYRVVDTHEQLLALTDSNVCDLVYVSDDNSGAPGNQSACYICVKKAPLTFIRYINVDSGGTGSASINWNDIANRPISTITDIDDTVSKKHEHTNIDTISKLHEDTNTGILTYNGKHVHTIHDKSYDYTLYHIGNDGTDPLKETTVTSTTKPIVYLSLYYQGLRLTKGVHYNYDDTSKKITFINGFYLPPVPSSDTDNMIRLFLVTAKD